MKVAIRELLHTETGNPEYAGTRTGRTKSGYCIKIELFFFFLHRFTLFIYFFFFSSLLFFEYFAYIGMAVCSGPLTTVFGRVL